MGLLLRAERGLPTINTMHIGKTCVHVRVVLTMHILPTTGSTHAILMIHIPLPIERIHTVLTISIDSHLVRESTFHVTKTIDREKVLTHRHGADNKVSNRCVCVDFTSLMQYILIYPRNFRNAIPPPVYKTTNRERNLVFPSSLTPSEDDLMITTVRKCAAILTKEDPNHLRPTRRG